MYRNSPLKTLPSNRYTRCTSYDFPNSRQKVDSNERHLQILTVCFQQNDNGLNLKASDSIDYMRFLHQTAASYGMKIGLKNSIDILNDVASIMDFAVNEQCAYMGECMAYAGFLALNKPVFHVEYPTPLSASNNTYCNATGTYVLYSGGRVLNPPMVAINERCNYVKRLLSS